MNMYVHIMSKSVQERSSVLWVFCGAPLFAIHAVILVPILSNMFGEYNPYRRKQCIDNKQHMDSIYEYIPQYHKTW